jgi:NTP pyrophosphatase (non-canonical NTP hydrolase)
LKGVDILEKLYRLAKGYARRFPSGNEPFQMATRLLEECGEVASEVNQWEGSGLKNIKRGEPSKMQMATEIKQALATLMQIAAYYSVEDELSLSIDKSLEKMKDEGLIV